MFDNMLTFVRLSCENQKTFKFTRKRSQLQIFIWIISMIPPICFAPTTPIRGALTARRARPSRRCRGPGSSRPGSSRAPPGEARRRAAGPRRAAPRSTRVCSTYRGGRSCAPRSSRKPGQVQCSHPYFLATVTVPCDRNSAVKAETSKCRSREFVVGSCCAWFVKAEYRRHFDSPGAWPPPPPKKKNDLLGGRGVLNIPTITTNLNLSAQTQSPAMNLVLPRFASRASLSCTGGGGGRSKGRGVGLGGS